MSKHTYLLLALTMLLPVTEVYTQVEVKQSTTVNGQTMTQHEQMIPCLGTPEGCRGNSQIYTNRGVFTLQGGSIVSFMEKDNGLIIRYCKSPEPPTSLVDTNEKVCHEYKLFTKNGTITEVWRNASSYNRGQELATEQMNTPTKPSIEPCYNEQDAQACIDGYHSIAPGWFKNTNVTGR